MEPTEHSEKPSQETNKRQVVRESRMKHTRGAERQDPDATASTTEEEAVDDENQERGAQDEVIGKGIEKPRVQESTQL